MLDSAMASAPVVAFGRLVNRSRLRILAYHGITDVERFAQHMTYLREEHTPITIHDVARHLFAGARLPRHAVWVTFDDGDPSVVENGLPILQSLNVHATLFVCPSVVDSHTPLWWQVIEAVAPAGVFPGKEGVTEGTDGLIRHLKTVDDQTRRQLVREAAALAQTRPVKRQVSSTQLGSWVAAGHTVGNHTWDHPCLNRCSEHEQQWQIARAHEWLARNGFGSSPQALAYPNGNVTPFSESCLEQLGIEIGLLFDHRLVAKRPVATAVSRLRVNDDTSLARFKAIVSGVHPFLMHLRRWLSRTFCERRRAGSH